MNAGNPLDMLRDIHLPGEIPLWPPAPGWWALAVASISLLIWFIWLLRKKHQQRRLLRVSVAALSELEDAYSTHKDPLLLIKQYSSLIRRIALALFPRQNIASLTGNSWLKFLDESAGTKLFDSEVGKLLIHGPYQKADKALNHIDELKEALHTWIKAVNTMQRKSLSTKAPGIMS